MLLKIQPLAFKQIEDIEASIDNAKQSKNSFTNIIFKEFFSNHVNMNSTARRQVTLKDEYA